MGRTEILKRYNAKPEVKARKRQWYLDHWQEAQESARKSALANPDRTRQNSLRWAHKNYFGGNRPENVDVCELCGSGRSLLVHHRDGNNGKNGNLANHDPDNLIVLCRACHAHVHVRGKIKVAL